MGDLSCDRFTDLLGQYVEGRLPSDERLSMEAHLLACPRCDQLVADYERIPGIARRATNVTMPAGAKARLRWILSHAWRRRR
jgi:anti-sigma factor RsiW